MKTINKDTKVAIAVDKCSLKEKRFVRDWLNNGGPTGEALLEEATTIRNYGWGNGGRFKDDAAYEHLNIKTISFKKFLKAINPYRGKQFYVTCTNQKQVGKVSKRAGIMGYASFCPEENKEGGMAVVLDWMNEWFIRDLWMMRHRPSTYTELAYDQFMNMELPNVKEEKLVFEGYEVEVTQGFIHVGCEQVSKASVGDFLKLGKTLRENNISPSKAIEWLLENEDKLNL